MVTAAIALSVGALGGFSAYAQPSKPTNLQLLDQALALSAGGELVRIDDMLFPREKFVAYRNKVAQSQTGGRQTNIAFRDITRWPGGRVYYSFNSSLPTAQRTAFTEACREWEQWANVKFIPRTSEADYIRVYQDPNDGSFSAIGMKGGAQDMSLAGWATKWVACHEIAHALGVIHEQCRTDRDEYLIINWDYIEPNQQHNFAIFPDSTNKGVYDFESIMHYGPDAFATVPNVYTMYPRPGYTQYLSVMGKHTHLTELDKAGMASIYGAPGTSSSGPPNDMFAQARVLTRDSGILSGTNVGATKESGEPNHGGDNGDATVWYRWTAPGNGEASFSTAESTFDTTLTVYTGTSVDALTQVAFNDDYENADDSTSKVTFNAVQGKTYSIVINGYKSGSHATETGDIEMIWLWVGAPSTYSLSGSVSSGGKALSGVTLSLKGAKTATTTSSSTGTYGISGLGTGSYTVTPSKSGYTFSPASRSYTLSGNITGASFVATPQSSKPIYASISSVTAIEGNAGTPYMTFNVQLSQPATQTVTLNFATVNGTAIAGSDYTAKSGTITFVAGTVMADIRIGILPNQVQEANETFSVVLSNPVGAKINIGTGKGTILNDDTSSATNAFGVDDESDANPSMFAG